MNVKVVKSIHTFTQDSLLYTSVINVLIFRLSHFLHFSDHNVLLSRTQLSYSLIIRTKLLCISPDPAVADLRFGLHAGLFLICSCTLHIPSTSNSSIFFQNPIWWTVRILEFLVMHFFPTFFLLPLFYSEYFPRHSLLEPHAINFAIWCNSSNKVTGYLLDDRNSNCKKAQNFFPPWTEPGVLWVGRDSGDGMMIRYRLDGPGIKYQW